MNARQKQKARRRAIVDLTALGYSAAVLSIAMGISRRSVSHARAEARKLAATARESSKARTELADRFEE